jgi:hypothetical protein
MLVYNLFDILGLHVGIPGALGINDYQRAVAALVEASGFVDADFFLQAALVNFFAQRVADFDGAFIWTSLAVNADKYVFFKYIHLFSLVELYSFVINVSTRLVPFLTDLK